MRREFQAPVTVSGSSNLFWYIRLRWVAAALQAGVLLLGQAGVVPIGSVRVYVLVSGLTVMTNIAAREFYRFTPLTDVVTFVLLALDVVLLTWLLSYAGGPSNPLILLYVVHVALGAVMVPPALGWTVGALVLFCYGALFVLPMPDDAALAVAPALLENPQFREHLLNQWWAFTAVAMLLAYFVTRVTSALILREREVARFAQAAARSEKMASLATLATGAAHELGTPLGTIGLVAKELERALDRDKPKEDLIADARLIASQVDRCRAIIDSMRSEAGEGYEAPQTIEFAGLLEEARANLPPGYEGRIEVTGDFEVSVHGPRQSLCQAMRNLMKNGLDASENGEPIEVRGAVRDGVLEVVFQDHGRGIPKEALDRVGEPFFTTKEAGKGMGLGLFVTQAVIERLGGRIELDSEVDRGTTVTVTLPTTRGGD